MKHVHDTSDDGGPAFPIDEKQHRNAVEAGFNGTTVWTMGMSRLDYFAAAALAGGLEQQMEHDMATLTPEADNWWHSPQKIAKRAYAIGQAMLAESSLNH